jgi:glycosyltransferase involved in cell wall biosynthesis
MTVKFSIIIPTRERHDTLPYAIQSVLNQTYPDFEIVVMDNCSTIETEEVVSSFADARIKYYRSPIRLSMDRNWELGISYTTGEYIFVLGDDDAMLPDGLELVASLLDKYPMKIVSWYRYQYFWNNSQVEHQRNKLTIGLNQHISIRSCRQTLINFYQVEQMFELLPMIYNSFVHRGLIDKIIATHGRYLLPVAPDVASGIVNAYFCDYFIYSSRSISIAGISKHSTGTSQGNKDLNSKPFQDYVKELELAIGSKEKGFHPDLFYSDNLEITIGNCQLLTKEFYFPDDDGIQLNIKSLIDFTANLMSRDPLEYDATLEQIKLLAIRYSIPLNTINVPAKKIIANEVNQGPLGNVNCANFLVINCEQNGVKDAAAAAMLAQSIWSKIDRLTVYDERPLLENNSNNNSGRVKIAFDIAVLGLGHFNEKARTGVFRVTEYILRGLINSPEFDLCLCSSIPDLLAACQEFLKTKFQGIILPVNTVSQLKSQNISLYHSSFYPIPLEIDYCRKVVTIYDLINIKFPEFFEHQEDTLVTNCLKSITEDDYIACISQSTKQDILAHNSRFSDRQVLVTHLAADKNKFYPCQNTELINNIRQKYHIPKSPYLLSVCTLEPRKNLTHVIRCFLKLIQEQPILDLNLVLVGTRGWQYDEIFTELDRNADLKQRIIFTGFIPDEDLAPLYSDALAFLYLSVYEGFGLPPLEAMQCGTPVITSNTSSLPEVVGDAGIMLSPDNVDGLCDAIYEIYMNADIRKLLSQKSLAQSDKFTWEKTLEKTIEIYKLATERAISIPSPQIVIDGVFFQLYNTGIARVWKSLLEEWANTEFRNHLIILDRAGTAPKIEGIFYHQIPVYDYNNTDADRQMLQQVCNDLGADLFISTYYTTPLETSSVFMGYDMIPEVLGADLNQPMWQEKRRAIEHASAYVTISEHTAQDLVEIYPAIDSNTVTVAHCGVQSVFKPASATNLAEFRYKYGIAKPYFIISSPGGYKNTELFLQAFAQLPVRSGFDIIVTGGHVLSEEDRQYTFGSNVHYLRFDDFELSLAYAGAIALVYPSKYEGFGLPIVEAMASGCPVITCPNASIPEVAGEAAIYVFDEDVDGMAEALCEVQKPQVRAALITAGLEQVKQFSWAKMADTVKSVLLAQTLTHLQLSEDNLIIFPDWSQDQDELGEEIASVCYNLAQSSEYVGQRSAFGTRPTLLIDTTNAEDIESVNMLISGIAMNLMMGADIDITEHLEIALTGELATIQWQALLPKLHGKIKLGLEDVRAIESSGANLISEIQLTEALALATYRMPTIEIVAHVAKSAYAD